MFKSIKRFLRKSIQQIMNEGVEVTESHPIHVKSSPFNKDFDGWQFRIHRANNGGQILEVWNDQQYHMNKPPYNASNREHKLFIINDNEQFIEEFQQIMTQLALERA